MNIPEKDIDRALLQPTVTKDDYNNALMVAERYLNEENAPEGYDEMISKIEAYEDIHYPIDDVTDKDMLDHLIEHSDKVNAVDATLKLAGNIEIKVLVTKDGDGYCLNVIEDGVKQENE